MTLHFPSPQHLQRLYKESLHAPRNDGIQGTAVRRFSLLFLVLLAKSIKPHLQIFKIIYDEKDAALGAQMYTLPEVTADRLCTKKEELIPILEPMCDKGAAIAKAKITQIYEGTNQVQRMVVAHTLLK